LHTGPTIYCYPIFTLKLPLIFILIFLRFQQLNCLCVIPARDHTPLCVTRLVIFCLPLCRVKGHHLAPAHITAADAAATWQV
jgi:hypothetical protein